MLKENQREILREMMADAKGSDRSVSYKAGVSQPTVTRARQAFVKERIIESFEIIPGLEKLGFEIIAFSTVGLTEEYVVKGDMRVVYAVKGPKSILVMSVHQNYTDYANFAAKYKAEPMFISITAAAPIKPFSFRDIPF